MGPPRAWGEVTDQEASGCNFRWPEARTGRALLSKVLEAKG